MVLIGAFWYCAFLTLSIVLEPNLKEAPTLIIFSPFPMVPPILNIVLSLGR